MERLPGWEQESWAYHGDDGKSFFGESQGQGRQYGPTFGANDTVGCGVNFSTGCAFFTKNGVFLGRSWHFAAQPTEGGLSSTQGTRFGSYETSKSIHRWE